MTQTQGFLGESSTIETGHPGTVLLHAPFDVARYEPHLFAQFGVALPAKLTSAVVKRQAEYLAGRALVARAFKALDLAALPVGSGPDRAPIWPKGVVGSISHSHTTCACMLSRKAGLRLGIDVETDLNPNAEKAVQKIALTEKEQQMTAQAPDLPALAFCAKETLFKALYPTVQAFFGFDSAEVEHLPDATHIRLRLTKTLHASLPEGTVFEIRYERLADQILTWLIGEI